MYTIEWQKRGLPHAQILIWLKDSLFFHRVDGINSAEIYTIRPRSSLHCNKAAGARLMRKHKSTFSVYEGWNLHK
ncbi:hypothetical protein AVEN_182816-1, partial [Araneus ventricosus]